MFAALPLLALPVLAYNLAALTLNGGFGSQEAAIRMSEPLFSIAMSNRAQWPVNLGDVMLLVGLIVLFIELLKSTTSRRTAIVNHALSMLLFVACLVEFLLAPAFATSTFFLLTVMVLLDVLAGFIVTIVSARRDVDFGSDGA
jgi:membrane-associated HD superfamily phosphohydrolase